MAFFGEYVPVAAKRAKAEKEIEELRKGGEDVEPVVIEGRLIARSFWGKRWCQHLESFSDYASRLPRGRAYVKNGFVCDLRILPGRVEAKVSGSSLYTVVVTIAPLSQEIWTEIKAACSGQIASMLELLKGQLSDRVMTLVTDKQNGLFPKPREIKLGCSCPDGARMCKHVAAVLYGVGSRLDLQPELLFRLREVDPLELIQMPVSLRAEADDADTLDDSLLADIFGIELDVGTPPPISDSLESARDDAASGKRGRQKSPPQNC